MDADWWRLDPTLGDPGGGVLLCPLLAVTGRGVPTLPSPRGRRCRFVQLPLPPPQSGGQRCAVLGVLGPHGSESHGGRWMEPSVPGPALPAERFPMGPPRHCGMGSAGGGALSHAPYPPHHQALPQQARGRGLGSRSQWRGGGGGGGALFPLRPLLQVSGRFPGPDSAGGCGCCSWCLGAPAWGLPIPTLGCRAALGSARPGRSTHPLPAPHRQTLRPRHVGGPGGGVLLVPR